MVLVASVTNVLGSNQVFGYNYSYNGMHKQPIGQRQNGSTLSGAFLAGE